ncbi:MAG: D-methionine-binding lipoprotein MetQ [Legionellaceae bacterium]
MTAFKKFKYILYTVLLGFMLIGCNQKESENTLKIGTIAGPETELMEVAKTILEKQGINLDIIEFSDYIMPNTALNEGSIDANMFQHEPYLEKTKQDRGYKLMAIGKTFIYPMAGYSKKYTKISALPHQAKIAIPNDPSNGARALLLLQDAGLITLTTGKDILATPHDILNNPKHIQIIELDAAQLARALDDVDLAIINTNYALPVGLIPSKDSLIKEDIDSLYANVIAVREVDKMKPKLKALVDALHSEQVKQAAERLFHGQAIPAWKE